ncbi:MAG TPA: TPM domain-containing protein [bacterium]|nr:TPM domain-containing protein [bacterium]HQN73642.1 TPM domain-containing protein [bacterium]HQO92064.1 TPM domain-containing protein [bacterium]
MKKILFLLPLLLITLFALDVPFLKGRVTDNAGLLSSDAAIRIEQKLASLETSDSTQIAVLTVPTLDGDSIEDFSMRVAEQWKIGQKGLDNGALLIIAKDDRKLRIEVGYGLEGKLTDATSGRIIRQVIVPYFKRNDFEGGVEAGVDAMIAAAKGEFTPPDNQLPISEKLWPLIFIIFMIFLMILLRGTINKDGHGGFRSSGYRGGGYRGGGGGFGGGGGGGFSGGGGSFGGGGSSGGW